MMPIRIQIKQLRLIFGTLMLLISLHAGAASRECAKVLLREPSPVAIDLLDRALENLARLKLDADTERAQRGASQRYQFLNRMYEKKNIELIALFSGNKTASEVRSLITAKIDKLQSSDHNAEKEAVEKREFEKETLHTVDFYEKGYKKSKRIPLPFGLVPGPFEYVAKTNSLIFTAQNTSGSFLRAIYLLDLKTMKPRVLFKKEGMSNVWKSTLSSNGRFFTALVLDKNGASKVFVYDLLENKETLLNLSSKIDIESGGNIIGLEMNPSGNAYLLAVKDSDDVVTSFLVNTKTNKIKTLKEIPKTSDGLQDFKFLSEDEIAFHDGATLYRYHTHTGSFEKLYQSSTSIKNLFVSPNLNQLIFSEGSSTGAAIDRISTVSIADLGDISSSSQKYEFPRDKLTLAIKSLPEYGFLVAETNGQGGANSSIILGSPNADIIPILDFNLAEYKNGKFNVKNVTVDIAGHRLFNYAEPDVRDMDNQRYIDIWTAL